MANLRHHFFFLGELLLSLTRLAVMKKKRQEHTPVKLLFPSVKCH